MVVTNSIFSSDSCSNLFSSLSFWKVDVVCSVAFDKGIFGKENFTWATFELTHSLSLNYFMYLVSLHQNKNYEHFLMFYT